MHTMQRMPERAARGVMNGAISLAILACGDSTGPESDFNPVATESVVAELLSAFRGNRAVQSLEVLGPVINLPSQAPATAVPRVSGVDAKPIPKLEPGLGRTLVYNPNTASYEFDNDASGAPANGVRFILYAVDTGEDELVMPLAAIGHVDLTDQSAGAAALLGVDAVVDGTPQLEYDATASGTLALTLTHVVDGVVEDGAAGINIDVQQQVSPTEGLDLDYTFTRGDQTVRIELELSTQTFIATTTMTVSSGGTTLAITTTGTPQSIDGGVSVNGSEVVRISGTSATPIFLHVDGTPVIGADLVALISLFAAPDDVFELVDATLAPAYWVFGLSLFFGN